MSANRTGVFTVVLAAVLSFAIVTAGCGDGQEPPAPDAAIEPSSPDGEAQEGTRIEAPPSGETLTSADARRLIVLHPWLNEATDDVDVESVSQKPGEAEAIVRAAIAGSSFTLSMRRFDTGWRWEAVVRPSGERIDPEQAIVEIRDRQGVPAFDVGVY
jgi:hypothetical protein